MFDVQLLGGGVVALFIYLYLTALSFVSTVLLTNLVVAATFLVIIGGCWLIIAALIGFAAVASQRPSVTAAVRHRDVSDFYPRDAMLARYLLSSSVRPSIRLSVTSMYCKTAKRRITQTTLYDSPATRVC